MKEFSTKDIVNIAGIAAPTVRKYAQALEKAGHNFTKNERGFRIFTEKDIPVFKEMFDTSNDTGMNVEQIAERLVTQQKHDTDSTIQTEAYVTTLKENDEKEVKNFDLLHIEADVKELKETVQQQNILLQELIKKMDQQQTYINEKLEQRDRVLLESIRESQEVKKQLLQIAASAEEEKKKGFFARLFGK